MSRVTGPLLLFERNTLHESLVALLNKTHWEARKAAGEKAVGIGDNSA